MSPTIPNHPFLHCLGRQGQRDVLCRALTAGEAAGVLPAAPAAAESSQSWIGKGVLCMLQRTGTGLDADEARWGLHSVSWLTVALAGPMAWSGPWPAALPGERTTLQDAVAAFGTPLASESGMALFETVVAPDIACSVHCQFAKDGRLQTLSFIRRGDWQALEEKPDEGMKEMTVGEGLPVIGTTAPDPAIPPPKQAITCASAGIVPKTGWYEGLLPRDHPDYAYFSQVPGRFVRKHEGEHMLTLGVVPRADEALVVWTWLREK